MGIRIAVDAMGGDHGPRVIVPGTLRARSRLGSEIEFALVGDEARIRAALGSRRLESGIEIVHAPEEVFMDESPAASFKRKPDSSLARGIRLVKEGHAAALISAGSTGAVVTAGTLGLGRLQGVHRPAITTVFPTDRGRCVLLDVGAKTDCKPIHLLQFAAMGAVYAHIYLGIEKPRVGLLNIGEEESKGNETAVGAFQLLRGSELNFIGNIEGRDILRGRADVVVCDGFVGNIVLKFGESVLPFLNRQVQREIRRSARIRLGAGLMKPMLLSLKKRLDHQEEGGAPLLGVDGIVIIAHGKSSERAIESAVLTCHKLVVHRLTHQITGMLEQLRAHLPDSGTQRT